MTNVILLIGPPGAGKSSLGKYIAKKHIGYKFINTGEHLRKKGLLDKVEDMEQLRCEAASFLKEQLLASARGDNILLEFVKETEDAYCLIEILKQHGANLVQVILMPDRGSIQTFNDPQLSMLRDVERKVLERTNKWKENVGRLIEFFSSTNALFILHNKHLQSPLKSLVTSTKAPNFVTDKMLPRKDSNLKHIQWMVSPRLLLTKTTCDFDTGLKTLDFALPRAVIRNEADLTWVNTDQYSVAHKCDGTRYFLIVGATGAHVFKNRVGFAYEFPLTNESIPPKTILDGELVWDDTKGIFFAFDALVVAGKPTWGLPLRMRVDELRKIIASDDSTTSITGRPKTLHRQRAPSEDAKVTVVCKRLFESLAEAMESQPTFPTDGLVFSPNSMPYVAHGLLTFKWHPVKKRACDIRDDDNLGLIFECVWNNKTWEPVALRLDKKGPSPGTGDFEINYKDGGYGVHEDIKGIV
jgi:adenylate kinase family enzyme